MFLDEKPPHHPGLRLASALLALMLCWYTVGVLADSRSVPSAGFTVTGSNPLDEATTARVLEPHRGAVSQAELDLAAAALQAELHRRGFSFHRVSAPRRTSVDAPLLLKVQRFPIDPVEVVIAY